MALPLSQDLRTRIVRFVAAGEFDAAGGSAVRCEPVLGDQADAACARNGQHGPLQGRRLSTSRCSMAMKPCFVI